MIKLGDDVILSLVLLHFEKYDFFYKLLDLNQ